jgi:hypothetical protein
MLQSTDHVLTTNRYDKLSNLPDHVPNSDMSSPRSNKRTDLITNAADTRIKSQRYMIKQPKNHNHHHSIQQEALTNNLENEGRSHQSGSKQPIVYNGHIDPSQRRSRTFNCDSASNIQMISDKSTMIKVVSKVVVFGDSHSRCPSAKLSAKMSNT